MGKQIGVVIFCNKFESDEGHAAMQWASSAFPYKDEKKSQLVHILLVTKKVQDNIGKKRDYYLGAEIDELVVDSYGKKGARKFGKYREKFGNDKENLVGIPCGYEGFNNVQVVLEKAIEDNNLDTLVLGMESLRLTLLAEATPPNPTPAGPIDLRLNSSSQCSVVLVVKPTNPAITIRFPLMSRPPSAVVAGNQQ